MSIRPSSYKYPHPAVTVDLAIFTLIERELNILLVQRGREPFKGAWALPGGFVKIDEDLEDAAKRELLEETGFNARYLEQLHTFGRPDRDPRERVISVAYFTIVAQTTAAIQAGSDAAAVKWHPVRRKLQLAFDHRDILELAIDRLAARARDSAVAVQFLPPEFTLTDLQQVHEAITMQLHDKRNFRKWAATLPYLEATGQKTHGGAHRPAELYRADPKAMQRYSG